MTPPADATATREARRVAAAVGCAALAVYLLRAAPAPYLLDSTELTAAPFGLGISHPPGHPAWTALAALFGYLPLGPYPFRIHLLCALCGAACIALIPATGYRLGLVTDRRSAWLFGAAALAVAATDGLLFQSIRAEVYALNALCVTGATAVLARRERTLGPRDTAIAALLLGVGLLNHHYLTVFAFPAALAAVLFWSRPGQRLRNVAAGVLSGAVVLPGYLLLLARGAAHAQPAWIWPTTPGALWWLVSAEAFQKTLERVSRVAPSEGVVNVLGLLGEQLGLPGLLIAALGLTLLALRRRDAATVLGLGVCFNLATQILFDFDPFNPDVLGYFMPALLWLGVAIGAGLAASAEISKASAARGIVPALAALLVVGGATALRPEMGRTRDLRRYRDSEVFRNAVIDMAPPRALLVTAYFETWFNVWYGTTVEDLRPDITHLHRSARTWPHHDAMFLALHPELGDLLHADPARGGLNLPSMIARSASTPTLLEADAMVTRDEALSAMPRHFSLQVSGQTLPPGELPPEVEAAHTEEMDRWLVRPLDAPLDLQSARNLMWGYFQLGQALCTAGRVRHCLAMVHRAWMLSPDDPDLARALAEVRALSGQPGPGAGGAE